MAVSRAPRSPGSEPPQDLAIYIHWPFCEAICPYCDFNVYRERSTDQDRFARALIAELQELHHQLPDRTICSVFFGGGTPSLMKPAVVEQLIGGVSGLWPVAPGCEITLEANPTNAEAKRFRDYAAAGITRLSLGVQALNDADLKRLGRWHSAEDAIAAIALAKSAFSNVSLDLIYARPGQTPANWQAELETALNFDPHHISLYQLTIEPGTAFERAEQRGTLIVPSTDQAAELYELTQEVCVTAGFHAYEISNHAKPGYESRHNLVYWRMGDYGGLGPGAHGRLTLDGGRVETVAHKRPETWLAQVESRGHGRELTERLSPVDQGAELLLMGLRLGEGVDLDRYDCVGGQPIDKARLMELESSGLLITENHRLKATAKGRPVLNRLIQQLLT